MAPRALLWPAVLLVVCVAAPVCAVELIANGNFEYDSDWEIPATEYPAAYTTAAAHMGNRSMRVGIVEPAHNRYSYSSARQLVTIPADAASTTLRFWLYPTSGESTANLIVPTHPLASTITRAALSGDRQYVLVLDEYDQWIDTLVWQRTDDRQWMSYEFDLAGYAGHTIKLQFGAYNDGLSGVTGLYVDDVSLEICGSVTPTWLNRGQSGIDVPKAYWVGPHRLLRK